ncbi:hypothetical protein ACQP3L_40170, partial [Escherichia coli]
LFGCGPSYLIIERKKNPSNTRISYFDPTVKIKCVIFNYGASVNYQYTAIYSMLPTFFHSSENQKPQL